MGRKTKMNSITSPELLAQVNPDNQALLNDFLEYLKSIQRSETTRQGYENDIKIAWVWCLLHNNNKFFVNWTKRNVVKYQNWLLTENDNSPARIRRLKASLSSLSNYIENVLDDEYPEFRNIINKVESPANEPVREKTVLAEEDVEAMLKLLIDTGRIEIACYVALAAYGGRRKSEVLRFKVDDFNDEHLVCGGSLWKSSPIKTKGRANGKYLNCYTLVKKFKPYLDLWLAERKKRGIESEWLFPAINDPTQAVGIASVNSWMMTLSRLTGKDIYAHSFRHFYTTMLSDQGLPDSVIKEIQGWKDISLVSVYVDRSTEDTLDKYFDANGIKPAQRTELSDL